MTRLRVLVVCLPYWGHLSTCLGVAADLTCRGDDDSFAFVDPPDGRVLREIEGHGHACRGLPVVVLQNDAPHSTVYGAALEARRAGILARRRTLTAAAVRVTVARAMDDDRLRAGAAALRRAFEALPEVPEAMDRALASAGRTDGRPAPAPA